MIDCFLDMHLIQGSTELVDDVILKKLLKDRTKERKRANFIGGSGYEDAEAEMERLCKVMNKLEILKQRLQRFHSGKAGNSVKTPLNGQSVIYVPVAELREKS